MDTEKRRLVAAGRREVHWRRWGPYLSERAWGTVREDYSADGSAWEYFPFEHAHLRAFRWGEDGIAGFCDNHQRLCFAPVFWNGRDPILKERLFGLSNHQGNHGEDVKELYYYLDATPTHSYMKALYKYPQAPFPYDELIAVNRGRSREEAEYELIDTGIFDGDRYFDIFIEYAKADANDVLIRITAMNRGPETASLHVLPTLWFRNTWSWDGSAQRPTLARGNDGIAIEHPTLGSYVWSCEGSCEFLFTENDSNEQVLWGAKGGEFTKDAFGRRVIHGERGAVNSAMRGTKACAWYRFDMAPGASETIHMRLTERTDPTRLIQDFDGLFATRVAEADEFYTFCPQALSEDGKRVQRQAFAGLLWSKQFYYFVVERWLEGDPAQPPPHPCRAECRNSPWKHLYNEDVLSMPDTWEYPWYAAWDLAFHTIPLALVDPDFAKTQLSLFLREWYMHPNGQLPAYEWNFSDVNPPVHAWACWRVFQIDRKLTGTPDYGFLEGAFHKLLMNFTWWVNRKDSEGNNIFEAGFLGLDNIGIFDRSQPLPGGGSLEQSDGTSWMAMYCLNMLKIALQLAHAVDRIYEDIASKFFEHFLFIAHAMTADGNLGLWDEDDKFFYDRLRLPDGRAVRIGLRSMVGLIPMFAVDTIEPEVIAHLDGFRGRMQWFIEHRPDLAGNIASLERGGMEKRRLLSLLTRDRLAAVLQRMLDENEFLSPHGVRSLSKYHAANPFQLKLEGHAYQVEYEPAESRFPNFGGNSNWRGPVWFPVNYLVIESLQKYDYYFGEDLKLEFPTGSGKKMRLGDIARELSRRLSHIFLRDAEGNRPAYGGAKKLQKDAHFRDYVMFYEYFHAENGAGIGASHQTGWTALVAKLLQQSGE